MLGWLGRTRAPDLAMEVLRRNSTSGNGGGDADVFYNSTTMSDDEAKLMVYVNHLCAPLKQFVPSRVETKEMLSIDFGKRKDDLSSQALLLAQLKKSEDRYLDSLEKLRQAQQYCSEKILQCRTEATETIEAMKEIHATEVNILKKQHRINERQIYKSNREIMHLRVKLEAMQIDLELLNTQYKNYLKRAESKAPVELTDVKPYQSRVPEAKMLLDEIFNTAEQSKRKSNTRILESQKKTNNLLRQFNDVTVSHVAEVKALETQLRNVISDSTQQDKAVKSTIQDLTHIIQTEREYSESITQFSNQRETEIKDALKFTSSYVGDIISKSAERIKELENEVEVLKQENAELHKNDAAYKTVLKLKSEEATKTFPEKTTDTCQLSNEAQLQDEIVMLKKLREFDKQEYDARLVELETRMVETTSQLVASQEDRADLYDKYWTFKKALEKKMIEAKQFSDYIGCLKNVLQPMFSERMKEELNDNSGMHSDFFETTMKQIYAVANSSPGMLDTGTLAPGEGTAAMEHAD